MRIKEHHIMAAIAIVVLSIAFLHDMEMKASAAGTGGDKVTRHRPAVAFVQDPTGGMTPYNNPAAYGWHPGSMAPDRPDGEMDQATGKYRLKWPIVAEYTAGETQANFTG